MSHPGDLTSEQHGLLVEHQYLSTACLHGRHDDCRLTCKWCPAPCLCDCHIETGETAAARKGDS